MTDTIAEAKKLELMVVQPSSPICPLCKKAHLDWAVMTKQSVVVTDRPLEQTILTCSHCKAVLKPVDQPKLDVKQ